MKHLLVLFISLGSVAHAGIPVLGVGSRDEVFTGEISEKDYSETLKILKQSLDDKVLPSITVSETPEAKWKLRKFSLGLGLTGEVGIGPYKYSSALKHRFIYSR